MAFFNWFSNKSGSVRAAMPQNAVPNVKSGPASAPVTMPASLSLRPVPDPINRSEDRKAKRNIRREQLYSAIRQSMTRAGVLSASFKFKVLSLDQRGDQFLVMMDVHPSLGLEEEKLIETEASVVQTAKLQFGILVTAVYWRIDTKMDPIGSIPARFNSKPAPLASGPETEPKAVPAEMSSFASVMASVMGPAVAATKLPAARYEPINDDEVAAFQRALAASTQQNAPSQKHLPDASGQSRNGPHSYTLLTGFEDTEMPESAALPSLSSTQYGELN